MFLGTSEGRGRMVPSMEKQGRRVLDRQESKKKEKQKGLQVAGGGGDGCADQAGQAGWGYWEEDQMRFRLQAFPFLPLDKWGLTSLVPLVAKTFENMTCSLVMCSWIPRCGVSPL